MQIFLILLLTTLNAFAQNDLKGALPGGTWVGDEPPKFTVKVTPSDKDVEVTFKKNKTYTPDSIEITFYDKDGKTKSIELKALRPTADSNHYKGVLVDSLSSNSQSYIGFEVSIPMTFGKVKKFKSTELRKLR